MNSLSSLQRYARSSADREERCELCGIAIVPQHGHVVDKVERSLCCACPHCLILFKSPEAGGGRFRAVPDRVVWDASFRIPVERWERLGVPVRLAFLFKNSAMGKWVAVYPSPGGPTEEVLDEDPESVLEAGGRLQQLEDDIEGFLVHGERGDDTLDCLVAPIDRCYELASVVRRTWKGFDGGEARVAIREFLADMKRQARPWRAGA